MNKDMFAGLALIIALVGLSALVHEPTAEELVNSCESACDLLDARLAA